MLPKLQKLLAYWPPFTRSVSKLLETLIKLVVPTIRKITSWLLVVARIKIKLARLLLRKLWSLTLLVLKYFWILVLQFNKFVLTPISQQLLKIPVVKKTVKQISPVITPFVNRTKKIIQQIFNNWTPYKTWILLAGLSCGLFFTSAYMVYNQRYTPPSGSFERDIFSEWDYHTKTTQANLEIAADNASDRSLVRIKSKETAVSFAIPLSQPQLQREDNKHLLYSTKEGVNVRYSLLPNGLKEDIILYQTPKQYIIPIKLELENAIIKLNANNIPIIYDNEGNYQFHFEAPYAIDAQGAKTYNLRYHLDSSDQEFRKEPVTEASVSAQLLKNKEVEQAKSYVLFLEIAPRWFNSEQRSYPVTIDPTVVQDESSEFGGTHQGTVDTGSGTSPSIESYYQQSKATIHTAGLWHFDESADNSCSGGEDLCDSSSNASHGTASGTTITTGQLSQARDFNGTSDYITTGTLNFPTGDVKHTIEGWIYPDATPTTRQWPLLLGNATTGNHHWLWNTDGSLSMGRWGGGSCSVNPIIGEWNHVAFTYDGESISCYLNGELQGSSVATAFNFAGVSLKLGQVQLSEAYFDGKLDEIRISTKALSSEEIRESANRGLSSIYTSESIDLTYAVSFDSFSWTADGIPTGDGETGVSSASSNLVAQWNFNETSGTTADNAEGTAALDGTLTYFATTTSQDAAAGTGWTALRRWGAGALMFDGSNDYVSIGSESSFDFDYTDDFSLEIWIKTSKTSDNQRLFSKMNHVSPYTGYELVLVATGQVSFSLVNSWTSNTLQEVSDISIADGQWHHVVGTYDGSASSSGLKIYIDGKEASTSISYDSLSSSILNNESLNIGKRTNLNSDYIEGVIDTTRIYNKALSASEILSNYNGGSVQLQTRTSADNSTWEAWKPTTGETSLVDFDNQYLYSTSETGLVSYWPMDETADNTCASGQDACDVVGSNHATDSGGSTIVDGQFAKSRDFDYNNDFLTISDDNSLDFGTGDFTISSWVKFENTPSDFFVIYDKGAGQTTNEGRVTLAIISTGHIRIHNYGQVFGQNGYYTTSNLAISDTDWHYVAASADRDGNVIFMLDGAVEIIDMSSTSSYNVSSTDSAEIGARQDQLDHFFDGQIDELKLYNRALTATELKQDFLRGSTTPVTLQQQSSSTIKTEGSRSLEINTSSTAIDADTVLSYSFNETNGDNAGDDIFDASSNGNNGEFNGSNIATAVVDGISGKARDFNGSNDYISITNDSSIQAQRPMTVQAWVKRDTTGEQDVIFNKRGDSNHGWNFRIESNDTLGFTFYGVADRFSTGTVSDTAWHHIAATVDSSGNLDFYIDGENAGSTTIGAPLTTTQPLIMAVTSDTSGVISAYDDLTVDETQVSSRALNRQEIAEAYKMGRDKIISIPVNSADLSSSGLLPIDIASDQPGTNLQLITGEDAFGNYQPDLYTEALWHFDEDSNGNCVQGSTEYEICDASGNAHHGGSTDIPLIINGPIGKARDFDGSNDHIHLNMYYDSSTSLPALTVDAWVNTDFSGSAYNDNWAIIDFDRSEFYDLYIHGSTGALGFSVNDGTNGTRDLTANTAINDGKWHHVAVTYDSSSNEIIFYVDGTIDAIFTYASVEPISDATTRYGIIGDGSEASSYGGGGNNIYYDGAIDELRVSSTARSKYEIYRAYEYGRRFYDLTFEFKASLNSSNLISSSGDTSFTIDSTTYGASPAGANLYEGEKVIVKENVSGTEYIAQGTVSSITASTGATTVSSWDAGSTFPGSGFTSNATVFKWQTFYLPLDQQFEFHKDIVTSIDLKPTGKNLGATYYIDDLRSADYLDDPSSATITSTAQRYFQYRSVITSANQSVSPALTSVTLNYTSNTSPSIPAVDNSHLPTDVKISDTTPEVWWQSTDDDTDDIVYEIQWDTDSDMVGASSAVSSSAAGFTNIEDGGDTSPFNSGDSISYTWQSALSNNTTYFYRIRAIDPSGSNTYSNWSTIRSFTIDTSAPMNQWHQTHADQFSTNTNSSDLGIDNTSNYAYAYGGTANQSITITNSGGTLTDHHTLLEIDTATPIGNSLMQSDCDDIRFWSDSAFTQSLDYFIESGCNTSQTQIWVDVPSLPNGDTTIYMTMDDPSASAGSLSWSGVNYISAFEGSCPSGWSAVSTINSNNYFLRGATSYGGTGGDTTHTHTGSGTSGNATSYQFGYSSPWERAATENHTHNYSFTTSGPSSYLPPYKDVIYCSYSGVPNTVTTSYLGFYSSVPSGWTADSSYNTNFPRGNTTAGGTGGSSTHTHTYSGSLGGTSSYVTNDNGADIRPHETHTHTYSGTTGTGSNIPPYYDMIFAQPNSTDTLADGLVAVFNSSTLPPLGWDRFSALDNNFLRGNSTAGGTGGVSSHTHSYSTTSSGYTGHNSATGSNNMHVAAKNHNHSISGTTNSTSILPPYINVVFGQRRSDTTTKSYGSVGYATITATTRTPKITASHYATTATWGQFSASETTTNGSITYQFYYDNTGTPTLIPDGVLSGNSTGITGPNIDLTGVSTTTYPELYVQANIVYDGTGSAQLNDWTLGFNAPPSSPTDLLTEGATNPTSVTDSTPELSAIYDDPDTSDQALYYEIEVNAASDFTGTVMWDSGKTSMSAVNEGVRIADVSYAGSTLQAGTTYYWRIRLWDDKDEQGAWSATANFTMQELYAPTNCSASANLDFSSITVSWDDTNSVEDGYEIERNVNSGGFSTYQSVAADSTSHVDNTVSTSTTYQYRIRATYGALNSDWCTTGTVDLTTGNFQFEGVQLEDLDIY